MLREFATPPSSSGPVATALQVAGQVFSMALGFKPITDNASVSLQYVGAEGDKKLMALGETPMATYLVDPSTLSTIQQASEATIFINNSITIIHHTSFMGPCAASGAVSCMVH